MEVFAGLTDFDLGEVDFEFGDEGFGVEIVGVVLVGGILGDRLAIEVEICWLVGLLVGSFHWK